MTLLDTPTPDRNRRSHVVALQFWTEYEPDHNNPGEMVAKDFVMWGRRGDLIYARNVDKVDRVRRMVGTGDDQRPNPVWDGIREAYEAWKNGQETPAGGLPLEAWPGLTPTQCRILRENHLRSVEDVAALSDGELNKVRLPKMRELREKARDLLKAKEGREALDLALTERDAKMAEMQAQLDAALAALARIADAPVGAAATPAPAAQHARRSA